MCFMAQSNIADVFTTVVLGEAMANFETVSARILEEGCVIVRCLKRWAFNIARTRVNCNPRQAVNLVFALGPERNSILIRYVRRRLRYAEELGHWSVARFILQPTRNLCVASKPQRREQYLVKVPRFRKVADAKINMVESARHCSDYKFRCDDGSATGREVANKSRPARMPSIAHLIQLKFTQRMIWLSISGESE